MNGLSIASPVRNLMTYLQILGMFTMDGKNKKLN